MFSYSGTSVNKGIGDHTIKKVVVQGFHLPNLEM